MFTKIVGMAITELFKLLDIETIKDFVDAGLDKLENKFIVGEVDTTKEIAIKNAIDIIRQLFNINDKKYGSDKA